MCSKRVIIVKIKTPDRVLKDSDHNNDPLAVQLSSVFNDYFLKTHTGDTKHFYMILLI